MQRRPSTATTNSSSNAPSASPAAKRRSSAASPVSGRVCRWCGPVLDRASRGWPGVDMNPPTPGCSNNCAPTCSPTRRVSSDSSAGRAGSHRGSQLLGPIGSDHEAPSVAYPQRHAALGRQVVHRCDAGHCPHPDDPEPPPSAWHLAGHLVVDLDVYYVVKGDLTGERGKHAGQAHVQPLTVDDDVEAQEPQRSRQLLLLAEPRRCSRAAVFCVHRLPPTPDATSSPRSPRRRTPGGPADVARCSRYGPRDLMVGRGWRRGAPPCCTGGPTSARRSIA